MLIFSGKDHWNTGSNEAMASVTGKYSPFKLSTSQPSMLIEEKRE
jgi:hypothetical protein